MLAVFLVICTVSADNWSQFRGPASNGHVVGPATPLEWSETKNVAWKTPIEGLGWSSPAVANGMVYLTTAVPRDGGLSLRALALNAGSGKVVWDREVRAVAKAPSIHVKNSHASPTPLVSDGSVFVHFGALGMARLARRRGERSRRKPARLARDARQACHRGRVRLARSRIAQRDHQLFARLWN